MFLFGLNLIWLTRKSVRLFNFNHLFRVIYPVIGLSLYFPYHLHAQLFYKVRVIIADKNVRPIHINKLSLFYFKVIITSVQLAKKLYTSSYSKFEIRSSAARRSIQKDVPK